jgi:hypothetical protein
MTKVVKYESVNDEDGNIVELHAILDNGDKVSLINQDNMGQWVDLYYNGFETDYEDYDEIGNFSSVEEAIKIIDNYVNSDDFCVYDS